MKIMFWDQNISIYINFRSSWGGEGGPHGPPYIFCLLFIKSGKSTRALAILKSTTTSFRLLKKFHRINNEKIIKKGPQRALLQFLYKVGKELTPGIF